jgi:hypothetical protein
MANVDRKWLPVSLIAVAGLASAVAYGRLPVRVDLRFEGVLPFVPLQPADPAPRWLALTLMPTLALVLWAAFRLAPTTAGQSVGRRLFRHAPTEVTSPAQFERFGKTYDTIVLGIVILLLGFHAAVLAAAFQAPTVAARIVAAVLGACLILIGNVMPRLRPNWVAGLRTRRLLEDPQLWRRAHRTFGFAFTASGLVTILAALVAPEFGLLIGIASLIASLVIGAVATTKLSGAEARR